MMSGLSRELIAMRVVKELKDGDYVNLGIGLPTIISSFIPGDSDIILHAENGVLGYGRIADEDEMKTGRRREGMFFGINALVTKPSISLVVFFFTLIIDRFGYDSNLTVQPDQAQLGIRIGTSMLSLGFLVLAIVPLILYPLYGKKIQEIKMSLKLKHEQME